MLRDWVWGATPAKFLRISLDEKRMMVVREGLESHFGSRHFMKVRAKAKEESSYQGRERLGFFDLNNGERALVRSYHHGGILRHFTGDFFFTWPPRPFRELAITEEVRRRGIRTVEVLGAWVERIWGPLYRGWLVTCELKGARDLWSALQSDLYRETNGEALMQSVARSLRRMHRSGVYHGDLNLKNILVRREEDAIRSYVIDFDKATLFSGEVPVEKVERNLRRLLRSVSKLDPDRRWFSQKDWALLIRFYWESNER